MTVSVLAWFLSSALFVTVSISHVASFAPLPISVPTTTASSSSQLFWHSSVSRKKDGIEAIEELLADAEHPNSEQGEQGLVFLFVSQFHGEEFSGIVSKAQNILKEKKAENTLLLALVGGGVIGGNQEFDDPFGPPAMSILSGVLPSTARAAGFAHTISSSSSSGGTSSGNDKGLQAATMAGSSHIIFCDPWSDAEHVIRNIGAQGDVIVGGLSCPTISDRYPAHPSVALNGKALPKGSTVGISFSGTICVQAVVAQGCRPIGPTFTITSAAGNILNGLNGKSAIEQLQHVSNEASDSDKVLIQRGGLMCGVIPNSNGISDDADQLPSHDFLKRQIVGLMAIGQGEGAIAIAVSSLREGDKFQFHVRDDKAAKEDMELMIQRTKAARLFLGHEVVGVPVAALQISCVARGQGLFGAANVDLEQVNKLFGREAGADNEETMQALVGGFFANGEIGPVGISGFGGSDEGNAGSYIHGFTTVVGLLCDLQSNGRRGTVISDFSDGLSSGETSWG